MSNILLNIVVFFIVIFILVFIHELGHFLVAKACKVKVLEFSVGFGYKLISFTDRSSTRYVLGILPLGGYVKMLDSRDMPVDDDLATQDFNQKAPWQKIIIVLAGPLANFILAYFLYVCMFLIGHTTVKPINDTPKIDSIAEISGIESGDMILSINDVPVEDWTQVNLELAKHTGEQDVTVLVETKNKEKKLLLFELNRWDYAQIDKTFINSIGFVPWHPKALPIIKGVGEGSVADDVGIQVGDEIVMVNDFVLENWQQLVQMVLDSDDVITLTIRRQGNMMEFMLSPKWVVEDNQLKPQLGLLPTIEKWPTVYLTNNQVMLFEALDKALTETIDKIFFTFLMIKKMILGLFGLDYLSGPLSIAQVATDSIQHGFFYFLNILALISINLGVINLLPIPVLDGGHVILYCYEWFFKKPLHVKIQVVLFKLGLSLLLFLMTIALINDIIRL